MFCLDAQGRERWRFTPGKIVRRGKQSFGSPFLVRQFALIGDKIIEF